MPALRGERKLVTVMFADISGFTAMSETMDPEAVRDLMNACFEHLVPVVRKYEGTVDKFIGDEIMALFGAPVAHENDSERALRAALEMQSQLSAFNLQHATKLGLHFGINTGHVIAGGLGTRERQEYSVMGDAVNLASRLEEVSEQGEILVGPDTYRLAAPLFEFEILEPIRVKGKAEPVRIYRLVGAKAVRGKARGIEGLESPLVGRDDESRVLCGAIQRLWGGVGGIVTVVGAAGLGKSRLVAEAREQTPARDSEPSPGWATQWVEGRCLSYGGSIAYLLWLDVLRGLLGVTHDTAPLAVWEALRERVQVLCPDCADDVLPYLAQLMSLPLDKEMKAKLRGLDGESLQYLTFHAVETLIEQAAQERPLVVVCEDLHWADPTSLSLLERLLALTDRAPLLLICVFRPETEHGCWQVRETAARRYHHRHIEVWLDPLTADESEMLVGNLLRIEDLPHSLRGEILAHAEGNPFYVEEIIRSLVDSRAIVRDEETGHWRATREVDDIALPDTLQGVLTARIDRLQEETKRVLQLASVVGRVFFYRVLAEIAREERELDARLLALQREQLIRERARVPELEYIFKHELTREAAYNGLLKKERRIYHQQVAEALERLFPERVEEQLGLLAHHWERAKDAEKAIAYLRRAGERAAVQHANDEAADYLSRALDLMPEEEIADRYALLLAREKTYDLQGKREAQFQDLTALETLANGLDDDRRRAEVALRHAHYATRIGEYAEAIPQTRLAIRLGQAAQDVIIEAAGYREWARALSYQGECEAAELHLERALALAREWRGLASSVGTMRQVEAQSLHTLGTTYMDRGMFAEARSCFEQELHICHETGNRRREGEALRDIGLTCAWQGDYAGSKGYLERALRVCVQTGNRRDEGWALIALGEMYMLKGDYARSEDLQKQALGICCQVGDRQGEQYVLSSLALTLYNQGSYVEAAAYCDQALHPDHEEDGLVTRSMDSLGLAFISARLGDYAIARDYAERAIPAIQGTGFALWALSLLGLASHCLGDDEAAWEYCRRAQCGLQNLGGTHVRAYALTVLGHALTGLGDLAKAAEAYREALEIRRRMSQPHLAVELLAGLGHISVIQGDLASAVDLAEEAWGYLKDHPAPCGTEEPFLAHLVCYSILRTNEDPRADEILGAAYHLLQERAIKIDDPELRHSFLQNVPTQREIVEQYRRVHGQDG
jgi:predicted ATPase/class 3 adenylate cyclase